MANEEQAKEKQHFMIHRIYAKDISFEAPDNPVTLQEEWQPDINVDLGTNSKKIKDNLHEVVITVTITAKLKETTAFMVEVQQAGLFTIEGLDDKALAPMLGSFCPTILFPYARETISDLVVRGGYPQLLLAPVNFDALYAQHLEQKKQQDAKSSKKKGGK